MHPRLTRLPSTNLLGVIGAAPGRAGGDRCVGADADALATE
jgi:hypothetical protein